MTDENENGPGAVTAADVNRDAMAAAAAAFGEPTPVPPGAAYVDWQAAASGVFVGNDEGSHLAAGTRPDSLHG